MGVHSNGQLTDVIDGATSPTKSVKKGSKKSQVRVFDPDGFRRRADCFCFRDKSRTEVLLVSSRNHAGEWTVPGGGLEPRESGAMTAEREALEEAGVKGEIDCRVGVYEILERKTRSEVYTMTVREEMECWRDNQEPEFRRQRKWFTVEDAIATLERRKPLNSKFLRAAVCLSHERTPDPPCSQHQHGGPCSSGIGSQTNDLLMTANGR